MLSRRRNCPVPCKRPSAGVQLRGAWPDVVLGYNASFSFLGTWTVSVIFPGDIEHIIWRTKLLSRSETPGEPPGRPKRQNHGPRSAWAPRLPGWNYTPWDPAKPQEESGFGGGGEKNPSSLIQRSTFHLLDSSHEVILILGIKSLGNITATYLPDQASLSFPLQHTRDFIPFNLHNNPTPISQRGEGTSPRSQHWEGEDVVCLHHLLSDGTKCHLPPGISNPLSQMEKLRPREMGPLAPVTELGNGRVTGRHPSPGFLPCVKCWPGLVA